MGPLVMCQVYLITHDLCQKLVLGLMSYSMWLFDLCNPPSALSELAKFVSQGSDPVKLWALGPGTAGLGCVLAPQPI